FLKKWKTPVNQIFIYFIKYTGCCADYPLLVEVGSLGIFPKNLN
ncbi:MAG: hypothetical protein ACI9XO_004183, partial [Paraglaciecola sp.]